MPKTPGSFHADDAIRQKFWKLVDEKRMPISRAAEKVGMSARWGYEQSSQRKKAERQREDHESPEPKGLDQIDGGVKDTLSDFNLFSEVFLVRRPAAWRKDAANRVIEMLLDKGRKDFVDVNCPPGAGKTTLFTFDIPAWLICGGGSLDPAFGRALRILLGAEAKKVSEEYVTLLKNLLGNDRPWYDKYQKVQAEMSLAREFGRFKPKATYGETSMWRTTQFVVAQLDDHGLYDKEPTVQAASRESGFLGERVDFYSWDDLATDKNSRSIDVAERLWNWFEAEAETRLEPGGVGMLVGQRLSALDLHRNRLDVEYVDEHGDLVKKYHHIIYPAHFEEYCDENHRQWDGETSGCLLDDWRLPWRELLPAMASGRFRTVYQQEDGDPEDKLVHEAWLQGETDVTGYCGPGCFDRERGFNEWPDVPTINYVVVDPSVSNYWAVEWWALDPNTMFTYLIWGTRRRMTAGGMSGFIDWDQTEGRHVGLMEELQQKSCDLGNPIMVWIVEQNAAHKYLMQTNAFHTWQTKWKRVKVWPHETTNNKNDENYGVRALLPMRYRQGYKRLPRRKGDLEALQFVNAKITELTKYPYAHTDDIVMADWFGEVNLKQIARLGSRLSDIGTGKPHPRLSPYMLSKQRTVKVA